MAVILFSGAGVVMFGLVKEIGSETSAIASALTTAVADGSFARNRLIDAAAHVPAARHVDLCA